MWTDEKKRNYQREWASRNKEKVSEIKRRWRERNREKIALYAKSVRAKKREEIDAAKREWERLNPEKVAIQRIRKRLRDMQRAHGNSLKFNYNITAEQYAEIYEAQGFVCAICKTHEPTAKTKRLFVDHDHETGRLRALLCHRCNSGLGYFKDSLPLIRRAIAYLEGFDGSDDCTDWPDRVRSVLENLPEASGEERRGKIMVEAHTAATAISD